MIKYKKHTVKKACYNEKHVYKYEKKLIFVSFKYKSLFFGSMKFQILKFMT